MSNSEMYNIYGRERIGSRQVDELTGLARGLCADGVINQGEVEFLHAWLAENVAISEHPLIGSLYARIAEILSDGVVDESEQAELLETLRSFSGSNVELGEACKATTLPLCNPAPRLRFEGTSYCFTGTFNFGGRRDCEAAVVERGGSCGGLSRKTDVIVIGLYATESWKHSSFGNKILKACEMRDSGIPISIVGEEHWTGFL